MAVRDQIIENEYALYNGDCIEVMRSMRSESVDLSIYSPPFCGLYNYSSDERDLSNCKSYQEFFTHYGFVIEQVARLTKPGRISAVHVMDVPGKGNGATAKMGCGANVGTGLIDFPGDVIRAHESHGFVFAGRRAIWKEPLGVRNTTMAKGLAHKQIVDDSTLTDVASADYLLMFRKRGENKVPVDHPNGLMSYAGERVVPRELQQYRGHEGKQTENRYSHFIWRNYASSVWDDIRIDRKLPYRESREKDDEKHVHPLQLDVIERACVLWSNPGEIVLTPFAGVGSEVYGSIINKRKAIGIELKPSYYRQAVKNCASATAEVEQEDMPLFAAEIEAEIENPDIKLHWSVIREEGDPKKELWVAPAEVNGYWGQDLEWRLKPILVGSSVWWKCCSDELLIGDNPKGMEWPSLIQAQNHCLGLHRKIMETKSQTETETEREQ